MRIIEFQLSEKQYINASMFLIFRRPVYWITPLILLLIILPDFIKVGANYKFLPKDLFILLLFVYYLFLPVTIYFRAKKFYHMPSVGAKEKIQIEFQESQLVSRSENNYSEVNWKRIHKVDSTKNWLYIWENPIFPCPIPKDAIWEGELMRLRELLDANKIQHNI